MLEAYTLLGGIAAQTKRVMLGTMVTGVTYRNPAILAKTVTTLDIVSGGRAMLGIGAAWYEREGSIDSAIDHLNVRYEFLEPGAAERGGGVRPSLRAAARLGAVFAMDDDFARSASPAGFNVAAFRLALAVDVHANAITGISAIKLRDST